MKLSFLSLWVRGVLLELDFLGPLWKGGFPYTLILQFITFLFFLFFYCCTERKTWKVLLRNANGLRKQKRTLCPYTIMHILCKNRLENEKVSPFSHLFSSFIHILYKCEINFFFHGALGRNLFTRKRRISILNNYFSEVILFGRPNFPYKIGISGKITAQKSGLIF